MGQKGTVLFCTFLTNSYHTRSLSKKRYKTEPSPFVRKLLLIVALLCLVAFIGCAARTKTLSRKLPVKDIAGMTSYQGKQLLLSRQGVILTTSDYKSFQAFDFNSTYAGYYDYVKFAAISASDKSICIAGEYSDGKPAVFESSTGTVWSERDLSYRKDGETLFLQSKPISLEYDASHDRFIMTCSDSTLFYMPGCSHCNSIQ